jgi:RimJ/RimL family protein N-acetyltransferase
MSQLQWPSAPPTLSDGFLRLRAWEPADADAVFAACQDSGIQRWTTVPAPYERHHAVDFVADHAVSQWALGTGAPLAVATAHAGKVIGSCGLVAVDGRNLGWRRPGEAPDNSCSALGMKLLARLPSPSFIGS